jgi:hypothetical protein
VVHTQTASDNGVFGRVTTTNACDLLALRQQALSYSSVVTVRNQPAPFQLVGGQPHARHASWVGGPMHLRVQTRLPTDISMRLASFFFHFIFILVKKCLGSVQRAILRTCPSCLRVIPTSLSTALSGGNFLRGMPGGKSGSRP